MTEWTNKYKSNPHFRHDQLVVIGFDRLGYILGGPNQNLLGRELQCALGWPAVVQLFRHLLAGLLAELSHCTGGLDRWRDAVGSIVLPHGFERVLTLGTGRFGGEVERAAAGCGAHPQRWA